LVGVQNFQKRPGPFFPFALNEAGPSRFAGRVTAIRIGVTYIPAMPKRVPRIKLFEWRVIKIRSTPAALVGYFTAANADDAIKWAIAEREINDPLTQSRKVREIAA
jgi:hypothetical protein